MAQQQNTEPKPKFSKIVKVKIVAEGHQHAGRPVAVGTVIEVPEAVARMLAANKIAEEAAKQA
jgi:hypothetical protein